MKYKLQLKKLRSEYNTPIKYFLDEINLNEWIGKKISIQSLEKINCISCGRLSKKSFNQGYCFPCSQKLAECDFCILQPEKCHLRFGTCRDELWAKDHCLTKHIVYLANSSGLKVGITRASQVPFRWIDQGATEAIKLFSVEERFFSGLLEKKLKEYFNDKTDWRKMLKSNPDSQELLSEKKNALDLIKNTNFDFSYTVLDDEITRISYPIERYLEKINSYNLTKVNLIQGQLLGIKGQYMIFEGGVFNVRSHTGFWIELEVEA